MASPATSTFGFLTGDRTIPASGLQSGSSGLQQPAARQAATYREVPMKTAPRRSPFLQATQQYDQNGVDTITTITCSGPLSHHQMVDLAAGMLVGIAQAVELLDRQGGGTGLTEDVHKRFNEISRATNGVVPSGGRAITITRPKADGRKGE